MTDVRDVSALSADEKRAMLAELLKKRAAATDEERALSHGQQALWFIYRLDPASSAYNIGIAVRIRADVDVPALAKTLALLMRRHPVLRTSFPTRDGAPRQVVKGDPAVPFEQIDASGWSEADLETQVAQYHGRAFDLEKGLAYRSALFSASRQDHVLLLSLHHIVGDGASIAILVEELQRTYAAETSRGGAALAPLACDYRDFVDWQSRMLAADAGRHERFWLETLSGQLPNLELPTDFARPPFQRFKGSTVEFSIEPEVIGELERLARSEGVTLFVVLLAAFYSLLMRYSGQTDIIVGTPTLGRNQSEFQPLVGYFVNPIALRATIDDDPTFRAFLKRVRTIVQSGLAHQDYPFPLLVERLQPHRDPSRSPVFQTMFNLLRVPAVPGDAKPALPFASFPLPQEEGQFDVALDLFDLDGGLKGAFRYDSALFAADTAERLASHYQVLLASAATTPDVSLSSLSLLTERERGDILTGLNATVLEYDPTQSVEAMVEVQAQRTPGAVAVKAGERFVTYGELSTRAAKFAAYLRSRGVGPRDLVGVCLERTPELVVALLGILKIGAAYVPLDPAFPPARLAHMVEDSGLGTIVTDEASEDVLPSSGARVVRIDTEALAIAAQEPGAAVAAPVDAESRAYVLYTSGSTGRPKGVEVPRRALTNFILGMQERPGISSADVLVAVTTLSFDIAGLELFLPLTVGATVVLATAEEARDGALLRELLAVSGATIMQATPATWHLLFGADWEGSQSFTVLCGGEPMPRQLSVQLLERAGSVWNMYGPTETTIWSTVAKIEPGAAITVGTPIANTQVYILDKHMQPVPLGVAGELCIAGDGVALGYLGLPELTAERFVSDPFSRHPGARMYRTGDLARFTGSGAIEYVGRKDFQVKVRGFRIELGEIEGALERHEAVRRAVAAVYDDGAGDKRLVAYLVYEEGADTTPSELRRFVRADLPDYMVPSLFVELPSLPLTANGKVDRRALPAPLEQQRPAKERVAPRTDMERLMARLWSEAIGVHEVSVHDNFFDVGGHSLMSMQIIARLEKETGVRIAPGLFIVDSLEQISAVCEQMLAETPAAASAVGKPKSGA